MKKSFTKEESFIKAQKKVKDIIGFYTHLLATLFIVPFIILINIKLVPVEFHWYWFFIGAWVLGLTIHWFFTFRFSKIIGKKEWEQKKIKEMMGEDYNENSNQSNTDYTDELFYIKAKKRIKEVKGFYAFLIVNILVIPLIIFINLEFVPGFHFFWFPLIGMLFALFMMWLGTFGFEQFGFGREWQQNKVKEIMKEDYGHNI